MPSGETHSRITACALQKCPLAYGDNDALIREYCTYPDDFYGPKRNEIMPYSFFMDGIQFHYPPHIPYEETYRYWNADEECRLFHSHKFVNSNFEFMIRGIKFYFSNALYSLNGAGGFNRPEFNLRDEAMKYLGCLLHTLEDAMFGLHALEGPGGSDAFVLDRMADEEDFPVRPSYLAARLTSEGCVDTPYKPHCLGRNVDEASMRLYSEYVARVADSRKCMFKYIMHANDAAVCSRMAQRMFDNAVQICADVIQTVFSIAKGEDCTPPEVPLTDLEPHVFPFGGFRPYRYTAFERNFAVGKDDRKCPLRLTFADGIREFSHGISFGTHAEGDLLFWIAPGSFDSCTLYLGFHSDLHFGTANIDIINDGNVVDSFVLDGYAREINIKPMNEFGLHFNSDTTAGCICICCK